MRRTILAICLLFFAAASLRADEAQAVFEKANRSFSKKEYQQAVDGYEQLLRSGLQSAALEYNLGNAYHQLGNRGKAVLHYERALVLSPTLSDAQHNLQVVNSGIAGEIEPLPDFFLSRFWKKARMAMGSGTWAALAVVLWWLGFGGWAIWRLGKNRAQKKWGFVVGTCCLLVGLLPLSLSISRANYQQNTKTAIVTAEKASLRSSPEEISTEIRPLPSGLKINLLETLSGWWRVKLANGEEGWVEGRQVEPL